MCHVYFVYHGQENLKIVSYVFLGVIAVCAILCIIAIYLLFGINDGSSDAYLSRTLNFTKVCVVVLIQLSTATLIASSIIKYQKSYLAFQIVSYVAHLYVDFYVSFFLFCLNLDTEMKLSISDSVIFLGQKIVYVIAILMLVYVIISRFVMKSIEKRHTKEIIEDKIVEENKESKKENKDIISVEEARIRLEELKNFYEQNLITEKEYKDKKADILKRC